MLIQALTSPEVDLGVALVVFLLLLIVSMVLNTKGDTRADFPCDRMRDFRKEEKVECGKSRHEVEGGWGEELTHPTPRNIDF